MRRSSIALMQAGFESIQAKQAMGRCQIQVVEVVEVEHHSCPWVGVEAQVVEGCLHLVYLMKA